MTNWMVITLLFLVLVSGIAPAAAEEFVWQRPGENPFVGDIGQAIGRFPMPTAVQERLITKVKRSMVNAETLERYIAASALPETEKTALRKKMLGQPFFTLERLQAINVPDSLAKKIMVKDIDTMAYTIGELRPGERCDWMVFDQDRFKARVVYRPTKEVREPILKAHLFEEQDGAIKYVIAQPVVCDNLCFKRVEIGMVSEYTAPAQPAVRVAQAELAAPKKEAAVPQRVILVNLFRDRENLFFRDRYRAEAQKPDPRTPYFRSVRLFGHNNLRQELQARPLAGGIFHILVRGREGRVLDSAKVTTGPIGQAVFRVTVPLEQIQIIEIQADSALAHIIPKERTLEVKPGELSRTSTLFVWFIQSSGID